MSSQIHSIPDLIQSGLENEIMRIPRESIVSAIVMIFAIVIKIFCNVFIKVMVYKKTTFAMKTRI